MAAFSGQELQVKLLCRLSTAIVAVAILILSSAPFCAAQFGGGISVVVRVNSSEGGPLDVGADVYLAQEGRSGLHLTTGPVAEAQFNNVAPGRYIAEATAMGYKRGSTQFNVDNSQQSFFVIVTVAPEDPDRGAPAAPGTVLAPKARKEVEKGSAAIKAGKFDEARDHLEKAQKLAPGDADIKYMLGFALLGLKQFDDAEKSLVAALSLKPEHVPALVTLGRLHLETGKVDAATDPLEKAVSLDASNWRAHWLLASAYVKQKKYKQSASEAESAATLGKEQAVEARLISGESLAALGRAAEAIQELQALLTA